MHNPLIQSLINDLKPEHIDPEALLSEMLDGEAGEVQAIQTVAAVLEQGTDKAAILLPAPLGAILQFASPFFFKLRARLLIARIKAKKAPPVNSPEES